MEPRNSPEYRRKKKWKTFLKDKHEREPSKRYQNCNYLSCRNGQASSKLHMEIQGTQTVKTILKKN